MNPVQKIHETIKSRGWSKGKMEDDEGRVCLLGAARAALIEDKRSGLLWHRSDALGPLAWVIREQYGDRVAGSIWASNAFVSHDNIWIFNDHEDTTLDDVERVLEKAAVLYDESL